MHHPSQATVDRDADWPRRETRVIFAHGLCTGSMGTLTIRLIEDLT